MKKNAQKAMRQRNARTCKKTPGAAIFLCHRKMDADDSKTGVKTTRYNDADYYKNKRKRLKAESNELKQQIVDLTGKVSKKVFT
jgi:hypothetical protein